LGSGSSDNPCSAITAAAGIPGAALSSISSTSPTTDFARQISDFFKGLLEDALSVTVETNCFFEISVDEEGTGVWIAFALSESVGSDASNLLTQELLDRGIPAESSSAFSADFGQGAFAGIGFDSLPGINTDAGGLLLIFGNSAVVAAGTDFGDSESVGDGASGGSAVGGSGGTPITPPVITIGELTGVAGELESVLKPVLETALGVSLDRVSTFSATEGNTTTVLLTYSPSTPFSGGQADALSNVLSGFGGHVDGTISFGGATTLTFSDMTIAGYSVDGAFSISVTLIVSLQVAPG